MDKSFERKVKEKQPVVAICYDFDKTLSPDDMQAQGFIQSVGYDVTKFWQESNAMATENEMDQNLAYMFKMVQEAQGNCIFNKKTLADYGAKVALFPGVAEWFERIREYGKNNGVIVEHYIISSGLKEMIEGTSVAKAGAFERIYANSFYFNKRGIAEWPAQVVNYTNKTQFLFRISKGVLDVNDPGVNDFFKPSEIRVAFRNMVYIGDSDTDVPCMKLVNSYGGHSIGVYDPFKNDKTKVHKMIHDGRVKYYVPADYNEGSDLDILVKGIIDKTAANEKLERISEICKSETEEYFNSQSSEEILKNNLIIGLEDSGSYKTTHTLVDAMRKVHGWSSSQKERILQAVVDNPQVNQIITDQDVFKFVQEIVDSVDASELKESVLKLLENKDD